MGSHLDSSPFFQGFSWYYFHSLFPFAPSRSVSNVPSWWATRLPIVQTVVVRAGNAMATAKVRHATRVVGMIPQSGLTMTPSAPLPRWNLFGPAPSRRKGPKVHWLRSQQLLRFHKNAEMMLCRRWCPPGAFLRKQVQFPGSLTSAIWTWKEVFILARIVARGLHTANTAPSWNWWKPWDMCHPRLCSWSSTTHGVWCMSMNLTRNLGRAPLARSDLVALELQEPSGPLKQSAACPEIHRSSFFVEFFVWNQKRKV